MSTDEQHHDDEADDTLFWARFEKITQSAMAALSRVDIDARLEHCHRTGQYGIHAEEADNTGQHVRLVWGGRTLAVIDRSVFAPDAYFEDLDLVTLDAAPDDPRDLT